MTTPLFPLTKKPLNARRQPVYTLDDSVVEWIQHILMNCLKNHWIPLLQRSSKRMGALKRLPWPPVVTNALTTYIRTKPSTSIFSVSHIENELTKLLGHSPETGVALLVSQSCEYLAMQIYQQVANSRSRDAKLITQSLFLKCIRENEGLCEVLKGLLM